VSGRPGSDVFWPGRCNAVTPLCVEQLAGHVVARLATCRDSRVDAVLVGGCALRCVVGISVIVFAALWFASSFAWTDGHRSDPAVNTSAGHTDSGWRRTSDGWQRIERLRPDRSTGALAKVHPLLLAALQLLISLFALLAAETPRQAKQLGTAPSHPSSSDSIRRRSARQKRTTPLSCSTLG